jgi:hypothetical protein
MCFVDLDPCEVWRETERKARKSHRCSCCSSVIAAGDVYLVHFNVFEGAATNEKMCFPCRDDRKEFADGHEGTLCSPGWLMTMVSDCSSDYPEDAQWRAMLERIRGRMNAAKADTTNEG